MALNGVQSLDKGDSEYVRELERVLVDLQKDVRDLKSQVGTLGRV